MFEKNINSLFTLLYVNHELSKYENKVKPDYIFTVFGPSYWRPKAAHTIGFALVWTIYPESVANKSQTFLQKIRKKVDHAVKIREFIRNGDHFIVETEIVKKRLNALHQIPLEKISVVNNTFNSIFNNAYKKNLNDDKIRILTIAANYPHKNLAIINGVVESLLNRNFKNFEFILTISYNDYKKMFNEKFYKYITTKGSVKVTECPDLYNTANIMFLPTLLECFSASYLEAMVMMTPIITSNLDFAIDICGDAAIYVDPLSPKNIADKIIELSNDKDKQNFLISNGLERLKKFSDAESRAKQYLEIFENGYKQSSN